MQRNITKKLLAILVVLMLVFTFTVSACDEADKFVNPSMPAAGAVAGNGGPVVTYGEYLYYVNGYAASATEKNGYNAEQPVKNGDIVRIKIADFKAVLALNDDEQIASEDLASEVAKMVYAKAEVVVPYFYYSGNTTTKSVNGLYIFGERLYFTTPNTDLSTNGNIKNNELCIYSCKLDGTDMKKLHTVASTTAVIMLTQVESAVYATYVTNATLYSVKLGEKAVEIAKEITSEKFTNNAVFFLDKDGSICTYVAGTAKHEVLVATDEDKTLTYTINSVNGDYVYFTMKDSTNTQLHKGIYAVKSGMSQAKEILAYVPTDSYLCYGESVVMTSVIESSNISVVELYITSSDIINDPAIESDRLFIRPQATNDKTITLVKVVGNNLQYMIDGKTYVVDLTNIDLDAEVKEIYTSISSSDWADVDAVEIEGATYYFSFNSSNQIVCNQYKEVDDEMKLVTTNFTVVVPQEDESVEEEQE